MAAVVAHGPRGPRRLAQPPAARAAAGGSEKSRQATVIWRNVLAFD